MISELPWIFEAKKLIGLTENTSKSAHNERIIMMLKAMGRFNGENKAWWMDDETPWCGLFAGYTLGICDRYVVNEWYRAKAWMSSDMTKLNNPAYGCIVVFSRAGGGHVGFLVGKDKQGNLMILGGNQSNAVNIKPFDVNRATGFYWPSKTIGASFIKMTPKNIRYELPIIDSNDDLSTNES